LRRLPDGPGHAESLICKGNLGGLLKEARNATAETVLREALSGMRKVLGEAHTATLTCSINLALVLVGKGAHAARAVQRSRDSDPPGLRAARARTPRFLSSNAHAFVLARARTRAHRSL
jgi:hypothetical protein